MTPLAARQIKAAARRPEILLLGSGRRARAVHQALSDLRPPVRRVPWSEDLAGLASREYLAVILVDPPLGTSILDAVGTAQKSIAGLGIPLFVVVPDREADSRVRKLYGLGASAVFRWPADKEDFARLLAEILGISLVEGRPSGPDKALARAVRTHLKLSERVGEGLRIRTTRGHVAVSGELESLAQKDRVCESISRVPGVKSVGPVDLRVAASGKSDRTLGASIRKLLRDASGVDPATLSIRVQNGFVTLAGTTRDRREMNRAVELIKNLHGIRGIHNLMTISRKKKSKDRDVARRLERELSRLFPENPTTVSVFGTTAVLNGRVPILSRKREIERHVAGDESVGWILNKIEVG